MIRRLLIFTVAVSVPVLALWWLRHLIVGWLNLIVLILGGSP